MWWLSGVSGACAGLAESGAAAGGSKRPSAEKTTKGDFCHRPKVTWITPPGRGLRIAFAHATNDGRRKVLGGYHARYVGLLNHYNRARRAVPCCACARVVTAASVRPGLTDPSIASAYTMLPPSGRFWQA